MLHEYLSLITNPAHTLVEFTFVLLDYLVIAAVARALKSHFHKDIAREHQAINREHQIDPCGSRKAPWDDVYDWEREGL